MPKINENVIIEPNEQELFNMLIKAAQPTGTTVRVAGGWVRDKLLGLNADDIDLVVDNMSGINFAKILSKIAGSKKEPVLIEENPEKTKNIETATANIPLSSGETISVDFAQARVEEYPDPNSRNPIIRPGTIEEDSMRRDLTINSMFYNIHTGEVEDFTGRGKEDLTNNILRSPREIEDPFSNMSPEKTFIEDPLRIFRVIRFAARYGGKISPKTYAAMTNPEIRKGIKTLAKERIGKEIEKTLSGPNPLYAMELLKNSGIWQDLINDALKGTPYENQMEQLDMEQNSSHHEFTVWGHTLGVLGKVLENYPEANPQKRAVMTLAAVMHDLGKLFRPIQAPSKSHEGRTSYNGHDYESSIIAEHLLKYMKLEKFMEDVSKIVKNHMRLEVLLRENSSSGRALRKFIRKMTEQGIDWLDMFNMALADGYSKQKDVSEETIEKYKAFKERLDIAFSDMGQPVSNERIKPILNGFDLMKIFNQKAGGPWVGEINEYMFELMDEFPKEARDPNWMKEKVLAKFPQHIREEQQPIQAASQKKRVVESKTKPYCPMHLFKQKKKDIEESNKQLKPVKAMTVMDELRKNYGDDEKVSQLIAKELFNGLVQDPNNKQNDLVQYVFSNAEKNFFDPIVCCYTVGLLLLMETKTKDSVILKIGNRMSKMSPKLLKKVLSSLPEKIPNKKLKGSIEKII